MTPNL